MINLDSVVIDVDCPKCGFSNPLTLKQVRLRDAIICRGCKTTLALDDYMNETKKAVRSVNQAMAELEDQLKSIAKITIKL